MHRSALDAEVPYHLKRQELDRHFPHIVEMESKRKRPGCL
jgi:hypothetical protein